VKIHHRLFLQVAWPGLLIGALLFLACLAAIWSVNRLQADVSHLLTREFNQLQAIQELETDLRQLRFDSFLALMEPAPARTRLVEEDQHRLEAALTRARREARNQRESALLRKISAGYERYREELAQAGHTRPPLQGPDLAHWDDVHPIRHILAPCEELIETNRQGMDQMAEDSRTLSHRTSLALILLGILGPASGLAAGYAVARGLGHSIARLRVRLQDVHAHLDQEALQVNVTGEGDIALLDQQVDRLVQRVRDIIQELDRQRQETLRAEQLAAVGQLAAGIAHEIRNPLTGIKMIIDVARQDVNHGLTDEDLQVIHSEVERIERKVQGLLDQARPPVASRCLVDLREVIQHALRLIQTRLDQQQVSAHLDLPDTPLTLEVDTDQFTGVLVNLFLNALDAMPRGGRLTVELQPGQEISLSISDTGTGVPPSVASRLFTPFTSTKPTGTGLGLSTSQRVVEEHGGRLVAGNLPEGGARFTIQLPWKGLKVSCHRDC
jgi:signal transduction histidine kinase